MLTMYTLSMYLLTKAIGDPVLDFSTWVAPGERLRSPSLILTIIPDGVGVKTTAKTPDKMVTSFFAPGQFWPGQQWAESLRCPPATHAHNHRSCSSQFCCQKWSQCLARHDKQQEFQS